jgi:hypothetical protein
MWINRLLKFIQQLCFCFINDPHVHCYHNLHKYWCLQNCVCFLFLKVVVYKWHIISCTTDKLQPEKLPLSLSTVWHMTWENFSVHTMTWLWGCVLLLLTWMFLLYHGTGMSLYCTYIYIVYGVRGGTKWNNLGWLKQIL